MELNKFLKSITYTLQDEKMVRWTKDELLQYLNEGLLDLAHKTKCFIEKEEIDNPNGKKLKYKIISPFSMNYKVEIIDNTIYTDKEDVFKIVYAYEPAEVLDTDIEIPIDDYILYIVKDFILSKCYKKENDEQSRLKSDRFNKEYIWGIQKVIQTFNVQKYQIDYYI